MTPLLLAYNPDHAADELMAAADKMIDWIDGPNTVDD